MLFYLFPAAIVCDIGLMALSQDRHASLWDLSNWAFIGLAALLWPLTLPSMVLNRTQSFVVFSDIDSL